LIPTIWRWKRWAISAFLLFHVVTLIVWNFPKGAIHERLAPWLRYYVLPTGLWQCWTMFAPDPMHHAFMLQALAVDKNGIMYEYKFPKLADFSVWRAIPRVRHSKYPTYLMLEDYAAHREMAARHVVRALDLPPEVFPVDVELQYLVREAPPLGQVPDPMAATKVEPIKAFRFPTWEEARP
jgi:hypothetical protein